MTLQNLTADLISAAYITLPFITTALDFQLALKAPDMAVRKRKLCVFIDIYDCLKARFDNIDLVTSAMEKATEIFQQNRTLVSLIDSPSLNWHEDIGVERDRPDWDDFIESNFKLYTTLFVYVDLVLSKGRLPSDFEYTQRLEGFVRDTPQTPGNAMYNSVSSTDWNASCGMAEWDSVLACEPRSSSADGSTDLSQPPVLYGIEDEHYNLDHLDRDLALFMSFIPS